jgi:hypothetical protein
MSPEFELPSPSHPQWLIRGMSQRRWYGDGEPTWKKADTSGNARAEWKKRIKFLRNKGRGDAELEALAALLESCRAEKRCLSAACPLCGRAFKRMMVAKAIEAVDGAQVRKPKRRLHALSLVPITGIHPAEDPANFDLANASRRMSYALTKAKLPWAIGGWDFSYNINELDDRDPVWSVHGYLVIAIRRKDRARQRLKPYFPRSPDVCRPIILSRFKNRPRRMSYAFKMHFKGKKAKEDEKGRNQEAFTLRKEQRLELYRALHRFGLASRVILFGMRAVATADGMTINLV